jgi:dolichol-phosphate mannosyltransferase
MNKLISIVIPVYNEEKNISLIYDKIIKIWDNLKERYDYEIIFINDGSEDRSIDILESLANRDNKVKYLEFARNFGKEIAITAGIKHTQGKAVIIMDGDLQHPPELIPQIIANWRNGAEIVIGVRKKNTKAPLTKKIGSYFFYKISNLISETKIVPHETDYRLLDRKVVYEFNKFTEKNRIARGLIDWLGFRKDYFYFTSPDRKFGRAGYGYLKLTKLALSSFVAHSLFPLKLAGYLGIFVTVFSGLLGIFILINNYILKNAMFSGLTIVVVTVMFLIGIVLCCLGLIALYIGNIHTEIANRPLYVLRSKRNIETRD